jgi:hypothetical protein
VDGTWHFPEVLHEGLDELVVLVVVEEELACWDVDVYQHRLVRSFDCQSKVGFLDDRGVNEVFVEND